MEKNKELRVFAEEIRVETLKELANLGFGHIGGSMSVVELLAVLYGKEMRIDPKDPQWADRDKLVMSKGHAGPAVYATLALKGYFPKEDLLTLNQGGTNFPSHCDRLKTTGVDMTTGSLGQGISTACGLALGNRILGRDAFTYLVLGDGECDEGQIWEGAAFAAHQKLSNLIAFVDLNKQQLDGARAVDGRHGGQVQVLRLVRPEGGRPQHRRHRGRHRRRQGPVRKARDDHSGYRQGQGLRTGRADLPLPPHQVHRRADRSQHRQGRGRSGRSPQGVRRSHHV